MQREEITVSIGPHLVRLLLRPAQVPPSAPARSVGNIAIARPQATPALPQATDTDAASFDVPLHLNDSSSPAVQQPAPLNDPDTLQLSDCLLGWELWPAAYRLAAYLASPLGTKLLRGAVAVAELGAGLGLPGIIAAKVGARSVTLTDLPQALTLLAANVELNGVTRACSVGALDWAHLATASAGLGIAAVPTAASPADAGAIAPAEAVTPRGSSCHGSCGDGNPMRQRSGQGRQAAAGEGLSPQERAVGACTAGGVEHVGAYDVVLAADVVYVSSMVPLLAGTIEAVCRSHEAVALVGHTVRKSLWLDRTTGEVCTDATDEPWEAFVDQMTRVHGFIAEVIRNDASDDARDAWHPDTFVCAFKRALRRPGA